MCWKPYVLSTLEDGGETKFAASSGRTSRGQCRIRDGREGNVASGMDVQCSIRDGPVIYINPGAVKANVPELPCCVEEVMWVVALGNAAGPDPPSRQVKLMDALLITGLLIEALWILDCLRHRKKLSRESAMSEDCSTFMLDNEESRPIARVRSNLETVDRLKSHEKGATAASSNPMESSLIIYASGFKSQSVVQGQPASVRTKMELMSSGKAPLELVFVGESAATHRGETSRDKYTNNVVDDGQVSDPANCHGSNVVASAALVRAEADKGHEVVVASSSVCSVNSVDEESNDPKQTIKGKDREGEELGYHSEDLEEESVGLKKPSIARTMNAKRSGLRKCIICPKEGEGTQDQRKKCGLYKSLY